MTLSTSAVAVYCCSDSRRSSVLTRNSRSSHGFLDRDDGLGRELLQQRDLLFRKQPLFLPEDHDVADHTLVLEQRFGEKATCAAEVDQRAAVRFAFAIGIRLDQIGDFDNRFAVQQALTIPWRRLCFCIARSASGGSRICR
jgi:hypothetical protein